jgi:hypothetical protein
MKTISRFDSIVSVKKGVEVQPSRGARPGEQSPLRSAVSEFDIPVFAWLNPLASIPGDVVIGSVVLAQTKNERSHALFSVLIFIATSVLLWHGGTPIE